MPPKQHARAATTAKPTSPTTIHEALELAAAAATARAAEGKQLYTHAADLLDKHLQSDEMKTLPAHMRRAFKAFADDIALVATRHLDAYIRGNPLPPAPYTVDPTTPATPPDSVPDLPPSTPSRSRSASRTRSSPQTSALHNPPSTYAEVTARSPPILKLRSSTISTKSALKHKEPTPDNRLFVRLPEGHQARQIPGYTILARLRQMPDIGQHLLEVQTVKTGFALRPASPESLAMLENNMQALSNFFTGCTIEKAANYTSYRLSSIPRRITLFDDSGNLTQRDTDAETLGRALTEATGVTPAHIAQTPASIANPQDYASSWIVRVPSTSSKLARTIILFGVRASVKLLPQRTTIIQCHRCFQWHNERICARSQRCRLCGSTEHAEADHPSCNSVMHNCPPRCLHCYGPHPADSVECLLRPQPNKTPLTKTQKAQVRQSCTAARIQLCQAAGCKTKTLSKSPNPETTQPAILVPYTQPPMETAAIIAQVPNTQDSAEATSDTQIPDSQPTRTNPHRVSKARIYKSIIPSLSSNES